MIVSDIMSKKIVTVRTDIPFRQLWTTITKAKVNAVPVVDNKKKLLGIITKQDLLERLYPNYQELVENLLEVTDFIAMEERIVELGKTKAKDIMSRRVIYTREDTPIMRALSRMIVRRVNQLPVLSRKDEIIGMVTKGDIFTALIHFT